MKPDYEKLAMSLMFEGKVTPEFEFRKGKTVDHVKRAIRLAGKQSGFDTNGELYLLEPKLKSIFKVKKSNETGEL